MMQTFLPLPSIPESLRVLDYRRLGKQRVEAAQILAALRGGGGWANHPATRMWRHHEAALAYYMDCAILEWTRRGYNNSMELSGASIPSVLPHWFGNPEFHASHRSNLLRKDPIHYSQFGWVEPPTLPYIWPEPQA